MDRPRAARFVYCLALTLEAVKKLIDETTAGILIEPVQGEGGVRDVGTEFLRTLRALCDEKGILLGFDEVHAALAALESFLPMNGPR